MSSLQYLKRLHLGNNQFTSFPRVLCELKYIQELVISNNEISEIPPEIYQLKRLKSLLVAHNKLKTLPESMTKLKKLQELDITGNQIRTVSDNLLQFLNGMDSILYEGNPFPFSEHLSKEDEVQSVDDEIEVAQEKLKESDISAEVVLMEIVAGSMLLQSLPRNSVLQLGNVALLLSESEELSGEFYCQFPGGEEYTICHLRDSLPQYELDISYYSELQPEIYFGFRGKGTIHVMGVVAPNTQDCWISGIIHRPLNVVQDEADSDDERAEISRRRRQNRYSFVEVNYTRLSAC